ncbi:hypothetical protein L2E82_20556 [Cichorium intybus]|uniref:Uncharacterized protein n=1 Tax=Cichorium intybus TaxID=13427 RepID=A0ACB9DU31_CICIN|nr:hypothetical protein L2E82_20556 [Cichorium intybus]
MGYDNRTRPWKRGEDSSNRCSVSRSSPPFHFTTTAASAFPDHQHPPSNSSTSSQTPVSRTISLPTPFINHRPSGKAIQITSPPSLPPPTTPSSSSTTPPPPPPPTTTKS